MKTPYEVLIRNGIHAHLILSPGEPAQPVTAEDWPAIAAAINPTALGTLATIEATHAAALKAITEERDSLASLAAEFAAYRTNAESALKAADQAIKNPALNDKDTIATIAVIVAETAKPVALREIEALQAEKTRLETEIAAKIAVANA